MWFVAWVGPMHERSHHGLVSTKTKHALYHCRSFNCRKAGKLKYPTCTNLPWRTLSMWYCFCAWSTMVSEVHARSCRNRFAAIARCTAPLCCCSTGQAYFSVQPPNEVVAVADQPVTQLECQAQCLQFPRSAESCTIKWYRWVNADVPQALSNHSCCHRLPYSEWTDRKASNPFIVAVHSKLIINKFTPAYSGRYFCSIKTSGKVFTSNNITLKAANASQFSWPTLYCV